MASLLRKKSKWDKCLCFNISPENNWNFLTMASFGHQCHMLFYGCGPLYWKKAFVMHIHTNKCTKKALLKCWWNCHLESISSKFYARIFCTKFWRPKLQSWLLGLKFWRQIFCTKNRKNEMLMKLTPSWPQNPKMTMKSIDDTLKRHEKLLKSWNRFETIHFLSRNDNYQLIVDIEHGLCIPKTKFVLSNL